jgi:hypothetical protein
VHGDAKASDKVTCEDRICMLDGNARSWSVRNDS